jgi:hypothetical protein
VKVRTATDDPPKDTVAKVEPAAPVIKVEPPKVELPVIKVEPPKVEPPKVEPPKKGVVVKKRPEPGAADPMSDPELSGHFDSVAASAVSSMQKGDWRTAIALAQKIERSQAALPRHRQTAFFVAAMSYCAGLNNPGVGKPYVKLIKARARRAQAATACGPGFGGGKKAD